MRLRTLLNGSLALVLLAGSATTLRSQEHPARRLANIVGVAVEEYAKGIDEKSRLISDQEYQEALGFLGDARSAADRLSGDRASAARALLDTLVAAMTAKQPPSRVGEIHERFTAALGDEGALELPSTTLSLAEGRQIFERDCASCHGELGLGDGPMARGMDPPPPAIGDPKVTAEATPALLYRIVSVGVPGTAMAAWSTALTAQQRWEVLSYVQSLHATAADRLEGEGLFLQRCASCHGPTGGLDGAASRSLTRLPPELGNLAWQVAHADARIAESIRRGVPGTAMPPSRDLSDAEIANIVAYVRSLPQRRDESRTMATTAGPADTSAADAARTVMAALDRALAAAQAGRTSEAGDRAFDAYLAFEPLETPARAKRPGLVASMEHHFATFRGELKANDLRGAQRTRDVIEANLPAVVALTHRTSGGWATFLESFLIILREGFEAILVIGAVVAFLIKTGNRDRLRSIWIGALLGIVASAVTAVVLQTALRAIPASRDLIEGVTLLVAVAVLFSVSYWLISKVEAAKWQQFIREKVTSALRRGGGTALAFVAFLAVYREGAETALFYQALFGEGTHVITPLLLGIVAGGFALALIFTLFYRYGVRIPLRPFFTVTSVLLYFMAFVFMGRGIRELQEVNVISMTVLRGFPRIDAMGIYPTVETLGAQLLLVVLFIVLLLKTFWPTRAVTLPTVPAEAPPAAVLDAHVSALEQTIARMETRLAALEQQSPRAAAPGTDGTELAEPMPGSGAHG